MMTKISAAVQESHGRMEKGSPQEWKGLVVKLFTISVNMQKELGGELTMAMETVDKIYDKCRRMVTGRGNRTSGGGTFSPAPREKAKDNDHVDVVKMHDYDFKSGVRKGKNFKMIYAYDKTYIKSTISKYQNGNLKDPCLVEFAKHCVARPKEETGNAYMVQDQEEAT